MRTYRAARATPLVLVRVLVPALVPVLVLGGLCARPAEASDLRDVFAGRPPASPRVDAGELLDRAQRTVAPSSGRMRIDIVRESRSGREESETFVVLRRRTADGLQILTENLSPREDRTGRVLQVETTDGETSAFVFAKAVAPEPLATRFRLADPFLCTWYDPGPAKLSGRREILARRTGRIGGEAVQWLQVKPAELRRFHHTELAIADRDAAILEYRHFLGRDDTEPALIVRAPREQMVRRDERILPGLLRYEDRTTRERVLVRIDHSALPADLPSATFEPDGFHRVAIGWSLIGLRNAEEGGGDE